MINNREYDISEYLGRWSEGGNILNVQNAVLLLVTIVKLIASK